MGQEANGLWKNHTKNGIFYIDGKPIGRIEEVDWSPENSDCYKELERQVKKIIETENFDSNTGKNDLEKYFNIYRTFLPKRYRVKTLILTLVVNQPYEYTAVDLSQYEERGIANFIAGRKEGWEEVIQEYLGEFEGEEELLEEKEWLREVRQTTEADGFYSAVVGAGTLLHYEELDVWDMEIDDEDL